MHSPDVHAMHMAKQLERDPVPRRDAIQCPVLVLVLGGVDDPLCTPDVLRELAQSLTLSPACTLTLLPGAGHPVFLYQPQAAYDAVTGFLASA